MIQTVLVLGLAAVMFAAGYFTRDWIQAIRDRDRYRREVAARLNDRERSEY